MEALGDQPPSDGSGKTDGGLGSLIVRAVVTLVVAFAPFLAVFVGPVVVRAVAPAVGWTLKKKTDGRRAQLLALMSEDEGKHAEDNEKSPKLEGTLGAKRKAAFEASGLGITDGSQKGIRTDWDGIVGFFHPFWYGSPAGCEGRAVSSWEEGSLSMIQAQSG